MSFLGVRNFKKFIFCCKYFTADSTIVTREQIHCVKETLNQLVYYQIRLCINRHIL